MTLRLFQDLKKKN